MHFFSWVDNRTLVACHCLLAAAIGSMLLAARRHHPKMAGIGSLALGFFFVVPATILLAAIGKIPDFWWHIYAIALLYLSFVLMYRGLLQFFAARNRRTNEIFPGVPMHRQIRLRADASDVERRADRSEPVGHVVLLSVVFAAAICASVYFTFVYPVGLDVRIEIVLATMVLARGLIALTLFQNAGGRTHLVLFGYSMAAGAAANLYHIFAIMIHGAPAKLMEFDPVQTTAWIVNLIMVAINGMFYLTMVNISVNETIEEKAALDFVTSTLNRRGIEKALDAELERAHRTGAPVSILLIDVDHFKAVNDRFGHAVGDDWLRIVSSCISGTIRAYDRLGRFGGDEFLLLLPETSGDQAMFLAARLLTAVRSLSLQDGALQSTLSIGITHSLEPEEPSEIFKRADAALYQAKQAGRDCARLQTPAPQAPRKPSREPVTMWPG